MDATLAQFVRGLYFELQTIEAVKPLEIWSGLREMGDPREKTSLVKNLYKIVIPLTNERCYGRAFSEHSRLAYETVGAVMKWLAADPDAAVFTRIPWPPTGDADQKALYHAVKTRAAALLEQIDPAPELSRPRAGVKPTLPLPDGLFDFREMRLVDNELPYIIFTDKEFRVIHGLAIVYLWLIDLDEIVLRTLAENGVEKAILTEYRAFSRRVRSENPLTIRGKQTNPEDLVRNLPESLGQGDYLDLFESVYAWFEQTREKLLG